MGMPAARITDMHIKLPLASYWEVGEHKSDDKI
jgi:hypothetical protein